ncbi:phospholipid N-methyltransferase [Clostridium pasteurianum DSM 525 = ATCC 6013]|uniref:Phospholipid N-methyltransferase n=1 Tax=Clostridium pasteurianum DSM 525 = ATCC 6013 TaxID=1262449 RepID=A0A0H3J482_CLOPA|nr:rRNA adenine N-6-methyltransferase family protein [Clostridium pasteurianum]AJA47677.1 phospholipid N-methyltransferase [Clostridium pasteurianum DSM 525 = ATCC 6013]AJA51665.1 phospholipid N-methyltransferase [Clostridium pasteurianum DSM 525 = ATCC 6013]AOZ74981.1 SAM-dependent methyltransferase [Clostridium pasteurianum DSM 525 = ATCC 6013]AOZ78776.1 SAM-dependent methyltransferase [Clostridium pasteurianum]ELP59580.1 phospholipid N-methyltransferase [Clostridium pasteurianum DSM 525 = A
MNFLLFLKQYITKPRTVGAVLPSSKYLATKMIENVDFNYSSCIVEYGPGTGVFTERILKKRKKNTMVFLFETNKNFYNLIKEKYRDEPNFYIINNSAEYIGKYLKKYGICKADYIVSGLPFASLPNNISSNILTETEKYLNKHGKFITFQYTLLKKNFIEKYFNEIHIKRELRNVPPAYVLCCTN